MTQRPISNNGFAMAVMVEGALALLAAALAWGFSVPIREQLPHSWSAGARAVGRGLLAMLPMLGVFWWLVHSKWPAMRHLRRQVEQVIGDMFPAPSLGQLTMVAVLAGVGEELLFRGALQGLIGKWTLPVVSIVITSLLFGLAHALSRVYFAFALGIGLFLGWMTWCFDDLAGPMVAHALYDLIALVFLTRVHSPH